MPTYLRKSYKMLCTGLDLRHPVDLLPEGKFPILKNIRSIIAGVIQPRAGLSLMNGLQYPDPVHSIRRLNDPTNASFSRIIGSGTSLYNDSSTTALDTGYSGDPLSMVPFRPLQSPRPWMYVSDSLRSRKVLTDGTDYSVGIVPPSSPPSVARGIPNYKVIDAFESVGSWAISGTAGAISTPARFATTIDTIIYDSGSTGWACVRPTAITKAFQPGTLIIFNATETAKIREVFEPITATTIASILYDFGTTGLCSIVLTDQSTGLQPDAMVLLGGLAEYVRILSATTGTDGRVSFRCSTFNTHSSGQTVTGFASFRVYLTGTFVATNTLTGNSFQSTITSGFGWLSLNLTGSPLNISTINNRPVQPDDYIHISLNIDNPSNVTGIRLILSFDPAFPASFLALENAYYKDITSSVFQNVATSSTSDLAAQQSALQRDIIEQTAIRSQGGSTGGSESDLTPDEERQALSIDPDVPSDGIITEPSGTPVADQTTPGTSQWTELMFKVSELSRIGSDKSRSLRDVTGLILQFQVTASTVVQVDSWWIGGTYGPDSKGLANYSFYQRYRAESGARSNPSPITRSSIDLTRENALLTPVISSDPQTQFIDLFVIGSTLPTPRRFASVPNTATSYSFTDQDIAVVNNEELNFDLFQPFPVTDLPHSGTVNVSGTTVSYTSGDLFDLSWQDGSEIIINSIPYTLYGSPPSTTLLFIHQNAGSLTNVKFSLPEPTLGGKTLASLWGPDPITGVMFGCKNDLEPGVLFWTNPNDPDTSSDANNLEITSPSEPLMNGFIYDGRSYVFSTERLFYCYPSQTVDGRLTYIAQVVPNCKGLFARSGIAVGTSVWSLVKDGIDQFLSGSKDSITDSDLYPLFPHDGAPGFAVNNYFPIDTTQVNSLRLSFLKDSVYLLYMDSQATRQAMRYDIPLKGWFPENFGDIIPRVVYMEEGEGLTDVLLGSENGRIYRMGQDFSDNGAAISCDAYTPAYDLGDPRAQKLFLDGMIDAVFNTLSITVTPYANNYATALPSHVLADSGRAQIPFSLVDSTLTLYRNLGFRLSWSSSSDTLQIFEVEPNALLQPYVAVNFSNQFQSHSFTTYGFTREGWFVWISTTPVTFTIRTERGLTYTFTLPSSGGVIMKRYQPITPLKGLLFFYEAVSDSPFALFTDETIVHVKEWGNMGPFQPFKPFAGQTA